MKDSKEKELEDCKKSVAISSAIPVIISITLILGLWGALFALRACGITD